MNAQQADKRPRVMPGGTWLFWALVMAAATLPWLLHANGSDAPVLWWAARSFGFVSYIALWLAMLTGVLVGAKGLDNWLDRKTLLDLHQQWTLAGVLATVMHVLSVVTNGHAGIGITGALVPFASERLTAAVGFGVLAFWAFALVSVSSWFRTRMSYATWRLLHTLAFGAFLLALVHSVSSGTDSGAAIVRWLYMLSGSTLVGVIAGRVLLATITAGSRGQSR